MRAARLDEELGLEPSPELQQLQEAILRQDASLAAPGDGRARAAREGVVTMLFTDIEGSTRLARAAGPAVAARARRSTTSSWPDAVEDAGGHVDGSEGDALFAYFVDPGRRSRRRAAAQRSAARARVARPVGELRVRMGIHTGLVARAATGYSGLEVHLAARVTAAGHGGQVVVSDCGARAARPRGSSWLTWESIGSRTFPRPSGSGCWLHDERGPGDFPPLRTEPVRPTNLPADSRRLVGREAELEALWDMLTGASGSSRSSASAARARRGWPLAAAEGLLSAFEGGVWLVALAGVREPGALVPAIAAALERRRRRAAARRRRPSRGVCVRDRRCSCSTTSSRSSRARRRSRNCSSRRPDAASW